MADLSEDRIDFTKLERELEAAVESDERYWRENDAKMRAVEQRVDTYEQFRDMVAAAHIKPIDRADSNGILSGQGVGPGRNQPWNPFSTKGKDEHQVSHGDQDREKNIPNLPSNSNDFTKQWRKLKENSQRYKLLIDIGGDKLAKIFHAEISFGLLGDILCVLNQCFNTSDITVVVHILIRLSQTKRFNLSLDFLSKSERTQCSELLQKLEASVQKLEASEMETLQVEDGKDSLQSEPTNSNSSNSKTDQETNSSTFMTETPVGNASLSDEGKQPIDSFNKTGVAQEIISKETLDRIKNIYKVLPLGR